MATRTFLASPTPAALPGTVAGTAYTIQNGGEDLLFAATAGAPPASPYADTTPKFIVPPYNLTVAGSIQLTPQAGESIYLWTRRHGPDCVVGWDEV